MTKPSFKNLLNEVLIELEQEQQHLDELPEDVEITYEDGETITGNFQQAVREQNEAMIRAVRRLLNQGETDGTQG